MLRAQWVRSIFTFQKHFVNLTKTTFFYNTAIKQNEMR